MGGTFRSFQRGHRAEVAPYYVPSSRSYYAEATRVVSQRKHAYHMYLCVYGCVSSSPPLSLSLLFRFVTILCVCVSMCFLVCIAEAHIVPYRRLTTLLRRQRTNCSTRSAHIPLTFYKVFHDENTLGSGNLSKRRLCVKKGSYRYISISSYSSVSIFRFAVVMLFFLSLSLFFLHFLDIKIFPLETVLFLIYFLIRRKINCCRKVLRK